MLKPILVLLVLCLVLCASPLAAEAAESNLPGDAQSAAPLPLPSGGPSSSDSSGNGASDLSAKPTSGVNATVGNVHVSLHMMGGAGVDSVIHP